MAQDHHPAEGGIITKEGSPRPPPHHHPAWEEIVRAGFEESFSKLCKPFSCCSKPLEDALVTLARVPEVCGQKYLCYLAAEKKSWHWYLLYIVKFVFVCVFGTCYSVIYNLPIEDWKWGFCCESGKSCCLKVSRFQKMFRQNYMPKFCTQCPVCCEILGEQLCVTPNQGEGRSSCVNSCLRSIRDVTGRHGQSTQSHCCRAMCLQSCAQWCCPKVDCLVKGACCPLRSFCYLVWCCNCWQPCSSNRDNNSSWEAADVNSPTHPPRGGSAWSTLPNLSTDQ